MMVRSLSRIVSHPKDEKLPSPLPAHLLSEKAVDIREREIPYPGFHSVPSYVNRLRRCSPARRRRKGFSFHCR